MSTFGSILSIARTAIAAHQTAVQTVSQNIANAETEGYSRQRVQLVPGVPQRFGYGSVGTGVQVQNIVRMRETLLDANYRREAASAESAGLRSDLLGQVQAIFGEPADQALSGALDAFWSSWSDLSNNPSSSSAQAVVRQRGIEVASKLNGFASRLNELETTTRARLSTSVDAVNGLASQLAELNKQITTAEVGNVQAPDLRDARDRIADQLSKLSGARLIEQGNGTLSFIIGGTAIVDGASVRTIEIRAGSPTSIGVVGSTDALRQVGGTIDAVISVLNSDIPDVRTKLDALAKGLVNGVNYLHQGGWSAAGDALGGANWDPLLGPTGSRVAFFDPARTTAGTISISAQVAQSSSVIAAGKAQNAPGDNSLALALAALRDSTGTSALETAMGSAAFAAQIGLASGTTYADSYRNTVTGIGMQVQSAESSAAVATTLAGQAETRRASVNGVSVDEELTLLLRHQQAFQAASRLVRAADEMAQTLIEMA